MSSAQKVKKVSAEYVYYAPDNISIEEAKRVALERAKIQAIADEFGTIVSQNNSTIITNNNGNSNVDFISIGGSNIRGEWIETIGLPKFEINYHDEHLIVRCAASGFARELKSPGIEFVAKPLRNGLSLKFESREFRDGDDLYLYFLSPVDGYIAIYLLDETEQIVYNILPYKEQSCSAIKILANQEYVFFSRKTANLGDKKFVDEYSLSCKNELEYNTLYIIFSPNIIGKTIGFNSSFEEKPNQINLKEFTKWLTNSLQKDNNIQLREISLKIIK